MDTIQSCNYLSYSANFYNIPVIETPTILPFVSPYVTPFNGLRPYTFSRCLSLSLSVSLSLSLCVYVCLSVYIYIAEREGSESHSLLKSYVRRPCWPRKEPTMHSKTRTDSTAWIKGTADEGVASRHLSLEIPLLNLSHTSRPGPKSGPYLLSNAYRCNIYHHMPCARDHPGCEGFQVSCLTPDGSNKKASMCFSPTRCEAQT